MAVDTKAKRWSMLALAEGPVPSIVFNTDTSGLVSIEKITVLGLYGGIAWDQAVVTTAAITKTRAGRGFLVNMNLGNHIAVLRNGDSLDFRFDRNGEILRDWVCTIEVRAHAGDAASVSRTIEYDVPTRTRWVGFLTSTEVDALSAGPYRLVGRMANATTGEEQQVPLRFHVSGAWA